MAAVNPNQFESLCKLFPELTKNQAINSCLMTSGSTYDEIGELRDVSSNAVRQSIASAQKNMQVSTSSELRSVFITRLLMEIYLLLKDLNSVK